MLLARLHVIHLAFRTAVTFEAISRWTVPVVDRVERALATDACRTCVAQKFEFSHRRNDLSPVRYARLELSRTSNVASRVGVAAVVRGLLLVRLRSNGHCYRLASSETDVVTRTYRHVVRISKQHEPAPRQKSCCRVVVMSEPFQSRSYINSQCKHAIGTVAGVYRVDIGHIEKACIPVALC